MPNDNVLTDDLRTVLQDAARSLSLRADELRESNTAIDGTWCDADEKAAYDAEVRLIERLRALLAAHPGQPVADDAAVRGDERAKRKAFTAVFLDVTIDEASEIVNHPKWSAGSWSHALDDRDAARAELARATSSQAHPGQPSLTNPLTPYGMLVRALRIVSGTTLMDMAKALLTTPAKLSAMEFGRAPVTPEFAFDVAAYFDALGVPHTASALRAAAGAQGGES
ncbi:hypothetical protein UA21_01733 [Burkholderia multivorans]|nr:hypothetical protein UA21_01733 [Burkholderia multivorans]